MNSKKILFTAFLVVVLIQLFVPAKMIWDKENVIKNGTEFKFKTAPIDPNDPFRGKYITLSFDESTIDISESEKWKDDETIYVMLITDILGFAKIQSVSREEPTQTKDFIKAKVNIVFNNDSTLSIKYPFDRYYMEESKAYEAEQTYRQSQRDTKQVTYALVCVQNGDAVLKDVLINGVSIKDVVLMNREE